MSCSYKGLCLKCGESVDGDQISRERFPAFHKGCGGEVAFHIDIEGADIVGDGPCGYSKEDFKKNSRAVCVAGDDPSAGMVLWYDGAWLDVEINEVGQGFMLEDLGLHEAPAGVSIWTGRYHTTEYDSPDYGRDYDTEAVGTFRELTPAEWLAFMKGENPLEAEAVDALFDVATVCDGKRQRLKVTIEPERGDDD